MSILIKDMEMPANCFLCKLSYMSGERLFCSAMKNEEVLRSKIASNCPLIEVPTPHGRLIDADALHEELYALEYARENEWLDGVREARGVDAARVALLDAPTIIEAEGRVNHENQNNRN